MKRSFKVATVFTGAAALAGGFGPAALAATTPVNAVHPDIQAAKPCGANNGGISEYVHLFYPNNDHVAECIGHGGTGTYEATKATIFSFCPGNNSGYAFGSAKNQEADFSFKPGGGRKSVYQWEFIKGNMNLTGVSIYTWAGAGKCT